MKMFASIPFWLIILVYVCCTIENVMPVQQLDMPYHNVMPVQQLDMPYHNQDRFINSTLDERIEKYLNSDHGNNILHEANKPIPKIFKIYSSISTNDMNKKHAESLNESLDKAGNLSNKDNQSVEDPAEIFLQKQSNVKKLPSIFHSFDVIAPLLELHYNIVPSMFNEVYKYNVSLTNQYLFIYNYNSSMLQHYALRVTTMSTAALSATPVVVAARQRRGTLSWQLPLQPAPNTVQLRDYKTVSRILCPDRSFHLHAHNTAASDTTHSTSGLPAGQERLSIDVSSSSVTPIPFYITTEYFLNFDLKLDSPMDLVVSPATPLFMQFHFPPGVNTVLVKVTANNTLCAGVMVQNLTCPVWDLQQNIGFSKFYQSMSRMAGITLTRSEFPYGFYVAILTLDTDEVCAGNYISYDPDRNKIFTIEVKEKISQEEFMLGIATAVIFCAAIYIVVMVKLCYDKRRDSATLKRLGPTPPASPTRRRRRRWRRCTNNATRTASNTRTTVNFASHSAYAPSATSPPYSSAALQPSSPGTPCTCHTSGPHAGVHQCSTSGQQYQQRSHTVVGITCNEVGGVPQGSVLAGARCGDGPATVLLSENGRFDDQAELTRELNQSMAALQRENPTLATENNDLEIINDSDSSMTGIVEVLTEEEDIDDEDLDADSAEGGYGTSWADSWSRGGRDNWSRGGGDNWSRGGGDEDRSTGNNSCSDENHEAVADGLHYREDDEVFLGGGSGGDGGEVVCVETSGGSRPGRVCSDGDSMDEEQNRHKESTVRSESELPNSISGSGSEKSFCRVREPRSRRASLTKQTLFVDDLSRKRSKVLRRRSYRYLTTLAGCFTFYFVPVLQLVSTYQTVVYAAGNQDICYYNFLCSNPVSVLSDFNHVFSNIGYVSLGLLFAFVTYRKQAKHKAREERMAVVKKMGIPRDYGLFYTLSIALMMEGMLSACYHGCPNRSNFQFDTAFMYVIAILLMIKLYQQRHPDITASADSVFLALAGAVLFGVIGGLFGLTWFWVVSSIAHVFFCFLMSAYVYYLGRWSLLQTMRSIYRNGGVRYLAAWSYRQMQNWRHWRQLKSQFGTRVALLLIANTGNWALMLFGVIIRPRDYDTFLLGIFLLNLVVYVIYYLVMKKACGEHIGLELKLTLLSQLMVWLASIGVFFVRTTDWSESPARSRDLNKHCIIFNFFDWHDVWHLLSSLALFTSYYLIMIIDDDLDFTPRDMIAVF